MVIKDEGDSSIIYVGALTSGYKTEIKIYEDKDFKGFVGLNEGTISEMQLY